MSDLIDLIIPKVKAQTFDGIAEPTFGPLTISQGDSTTTATVLLSTNKTSVEVGEEFIVTVAIDTKTREIESYQVLIGYDETALTVIDQDTGESGTQISVLDESFEVVENSVNSGEVRVELSSEGRSEVNRNVFQVTFQAQREGTQRLEIERGADGTFLRSESGINLFFNDNTVDVVVAEEGTNPEPNPQPQPEPEPEPGPPSIPNRPVEIPDTSLNGGVFILIPLLLGFLLFLLGVLLRLKSSKTT